MSKFWDNDVRPPAAAGEGVPPHHAKIGRAGWPRCPRRTKPYTLLATVLAATLKPPAQITSTTARFLAPSVRDIIFIFLFWSLLAGPLSNRPLADADIGWHIRAGEWILATHSLPRSDPFSSTMQGQPWFAWEWLYDILLGMLHRAGGLNAVVWLCALAVAAAFALLLWQLVQSGTGLLLAVVLMLLAEAAATIHLYARPHIVSWLFSLLWFLALERWECATAGELPRWIPWFFPVSMLLWVNLHGGWILGFVLLGIYGLAAWIESVRTHDALAAIRAAHRARGMAVAWMLSLAATLGNPYGWRLHAHIYRYLNDRYLMSHIDEFRSPDFHGWAQRSFAAILVLTLIAFARDGSAAGNGRLRLSQLLVALVAVYAGFYSARNLPVSSMLLALMVGPTLWESFAGLAEKPGAWQWLRWGAARISEFSGRMSAQEMELRGHLWPVVAVVLGLAICLHGGWLGPWKLFYAQFDRKTMPLAAAEFLQKESFLQKDGKPSAEAVFAPDAWGGYLIYRMYPERKMVIDDRHDLYGSERIRQYLVLTQGGPGWQSVLEKWRIRTALLPVDSTLANLLRELPQDWRITYQDGVAVVLEKR